VEVRGFEPLAPAVRRQFGASALPASSRVPAAQSTFTAETAYAVLPHARTASAAFLPPLQVDPLDRVLLGAFASAFMAGCPMLLTHMN
jgi:hypothetical protein